VQPPFRSQLPTPVAAKLQPKVPPELAVAAPATLNAAARVTAPASFFRSYIPHSPDPEGVSFRPSAERLTPIPVDYISAFDE
jgi:hypothetical protein